MRAPSTLARTIVADSSGVPSKPSQVPTSRSPVIPVADSTAIAVCEAT
jgi:hypothetical protein